jgi:hypothetical protein
VKPFPDYFPKAYLHPGLKGKFNVILSTHFSVTTISFSLPVISNGWRLQPEN